MKKLKAILLIAITAAFALPAIGAAPAVAVGAGLKLAYDSTEAYNPSAANALITAADLEFHGEELRDLQDAIFDLTFNDPKPKDFHMIVTGIVASKQIGYIGRLGKVGKSGKGCDPADDTNNIPMSEKFWEPKSISVRLSACKSDLLNTLFQYGLNKGVKAADITTTTFFNMIEEMFPRENMEALYRHAWFGDVDAAATDDSPAGNLTAGTDVSFFNAIDGLFKQLSVIVTATPARLTTGLATKNTAATFALQAFNDTDTTNRVVTKTLQKMKYSADMRLRGQANLIYITTQSVADQYEQELIATSTAYTIDLLENGMSVLKSGGITVYGFQLWDRIIQEDFSNGTKYYKPHRALLTTRDNMAIGLEMEDTFNGLDVFYDKKSKRNYIDGEYTMDAKVMRNEMIQLAW